MGNAKQMGLGLLLYDLEIEKYDCNRGFESHNGSMLHDLDQSNDVDNAKKGHGFRVIVI